MKENHEMKTYQSIVIGVVIGFLAGVGTMQATIMADVRTHETRIGHIESDAKQQMAGFEQRMDKLVRMLEALLETNRDLIARWDAKQGNTNHQVKP